MKRRASPKAEPVVGGPDEPRTATTLAAMEAPSDRTHERPGVVVIHPRGLGDAPPVFRIAARTEVGRSRSAGVRLDDPRVSRAHALVEAVSRGLLVRDLRSRHGSKLAGRVAGTESTLVPYGSVVRFGDTLCLCVRDVERYRTAPRRVTGSLLGLPRDVLAGPLMAEVLDQAARAASISYPVLVLGESGSGKECVARMVHHAGGAERPFVSVNLAAIPAALFEAELFGYERGAFTGATVDRRGAFREAHGGVLFLDEVADLELALQAKLLRALELEAVRPLGASREAPAHVRIVAATSRDLRAASEEGRFRADLLYRLSGVVVQVPALWERPDDIVLLALAMLSEEAPRLTFTPDAIERLVLTRHEGNVRSLRYALIHAVNRAAVRGTREIGVADLPQLPIAEPPEVVLTESELRAAMHKTGGVAAKAADALGVSRTTFYNACRRLGVVASSLRTEQSDPSRRT